VPLFPERLYKHVAHSGLETMYEHSPLSYQCEILTSFDVLNSKINTVYTDHAFRISFQC
jgi:hypothetical protein